MALLQATIMFCNYQRCSLKIKLKLGQLYNYLGIGAASVLEITNNETARRAKPPKANLLVIIVLRFIS